MAKTGEKGHLLEELLRAYFLRAGMYVVRGVPLRLEGDDLTDIDVWMYERPTGSSRRVQIVDAKSKSKPKAVERLFWTKGLYELLKVDGAYIATTDERLLLKEMSRRLGVSILDGGDLRRISESEKVLFSERLSEEDLDKAIKGVDKSRKNKDLQLGYHDLKAALIDGFGAGTVNRALDHFAEFSKILNSSHPDSISAEVSLRLAYLSASICAIALDSSLAKVSFKSLDERRKTLLNVIRYGNEDDYRGQEKIRVASALVEMYASNGRATARAMKNAINDAYSKIPAEIITDHVLTHLKNEGLFRVARSLEFEGFKKSPLGFDALSAEDRSFLGVLMDFVGVSREAFANAWTSKGEKVHSMPVEKVEPGPGSLFD
jgi:hypothetical protein